MIRKFYKMPDGRMAVWHFGDIEKPVDLVFCHANGFNARINRKMLEGLGVHVMALDMRGHGRTELPTDRARLKSFQPFGDDIAEFFRRYIDRPVVLAGHSFGGTSAALAAPYIQGKIRGFVGFDPVSMPGYMRWPSHFSAGRAWMRKNASIAKQAGNRRSQFDSLEAAFVRYQNRGAFRGVPDDVLRDYLTDGLTEAGNGVKLSCDPLWEQAIYTAQAHNVFRAARSLPKTNTHIYYAAKNAVSSPFSRWSMRRAVGSKNVTFCPGFHHLFPFTQTVFCQEALTRAIRG